MKRTTYSLTRTSTKRLARLRREIDEELGRRSAGVQPFDLERLLWGDVPRKPRPPKPAA